MAEIMIRRTINENPYTHVLSRLTNQFLDFAVLEERIEHSKKDGLIVPVTNGQMTVMAPVKYLHLDSDAWKMVREAKEKNSNKNCGC